MMQINVKQGIKRFVKKGNNALVKELNQLPIRLALLPRKKEDMSYKKRKNALQL